MFIGNVEIGPICGVAVFRAVKTQVVPGVVFVGGNNDHPFVGRRVPYPGLGPVWQAEGFPAVGQGDDVFAFLLCGL